MEYTRLGSSGLKVSRIAIGTMCIGDSPTGRAGWPVPYDEARQLFRLALDVGINFRDTAHGYNSGTSERAVVDASQAVDRNQSAGSIHRTGSIEDEAGDHGRVGDHGDV